MRRVFSILMAVLLLAPPLRAAELSVLSAGAIEPGLKAASAAWQRASGDVVRITFATAPQLRKRVGGGEAADVVIAPPTLIEEFARDGKVTALRSGVGRVGLGIAVRPDAPLPDISSAAALERAVLDALVYTGEGSPTLAERKKSLPQYRASNRRPINRDFVRSIFTRDGNPDAYDPAVVERFADQVLALDDSMPTGTYVDMSANLPVLDPAKIRVPTVVLRSQWDGIATEQDVFNFFSRLPNPDKQLTVMPGIAHTSLRSKNWRMVYDIVDACCSRAPPVYTG